MKKVEKLQEKEVCVGNLCCDEHYCKSEYNGWLCAREEGHKGIHIACSDITHNLSSWDNEKD